MRHLIDKNPTSCVDGKTPLHAAAMGGHFEVCKLIVENVENINPPDHSGHTPLHEVAERGDYKIFRYIANSIDDKNPRDTSGITPLHLAA